MKKRGLYLSFTADEKARVAKYGNTNGVRADVRYYSNELRKDLKENTARDWAKAYQKELQKKRKSMEMGGDDLVVTELPGKRPFVLGEKIDTEVQTIIRATSDSGAVVNTSIAIATAVGVLSKRDRSILKENGGPL